MLVKDVKEKGYYITKIKGRLGKAQVEMIVVEPDRYGGKPHQVIHCQDIEQQVSFKLLTCVNIVRPMTDAEVLEARGEAIVREQQALDWDCEWQRCEPFSKPVPIVASLGTAFRHAVQLRLCEFAALVDAGHWASLDAALAAFAGQLQAPNSPGAAECRKAGLAQLPRNASDLATNVEKSA